MKTTFIIDPEGAIVVGVPGGAAADFETARGRILKALESLGQTCPEIKMQGVPEQHRHDDTGKAHTNVNA